MLGNITLALAVLGSVLGLYNAWRNWIQDRVRLRVKATQGYDGEGTRLLLVEIVNLSSFPLTVTHVGFDLLGTDRHAQILQPTFARGETLPVRLESRTSATVFHRWAESPPDGWHVVRRVYVNTACDLKRVSGGRVFDEYRIALAAGNAKG